MCKDEARLWGGHHSDIVKAHHVRSLKRNLEKIFRSWKTLERATQILSAKKGATFMKQKYRNAVSNEYNVVSTIANLSVYPEVVFQKQSKPTRAKFDEHFRWLPQQIPDRL